jgi:hypothetical protein
VPAISTDTYVRMDLQDPVLSRPWLDGTAVIGSGGTTALTIAEYRTLMRGTLVNLYNTAPAVTGAYGPRCDRHVGIEDTEATGIDVTPDYVLFPPTIGPSSTMHDALSAWWNAGSITPIRHIDWGIFIPLSTCAP